MDVREEVHGIVDALSESDLLVVRRLLRGLVLPEAPETVAPPRSEEERLARTDAACGSLAHVPGSVDEFLARKHKDTEREEERYRRRHGEAS